ncbi:hypothetical protein AVEN_190415-1 [Araneus ventricosus]|uniref:Uncharacterized protein n=1 Tax=Araneus ventricosus TaxID=182803 RepID=A0A4Y2LBZ2_ARAVE|nr:hypothetical protein AVEN_190415-1 [Araneus ventricosus]
MAANSSHIKGWGVAKQCQCIRSLERCPDIGLATRHGNGTTCWNSTDHSPQVRSSSGSGFAKPHDVGTRLYHVQMHTLAQTDGFLVDGIPRVFSGILLLIYCYYRLYSSV